MREILFRGKRVDKEHEWAEGIAFPHDNRSVTMFRQHPMDGSLEGVEVILETVGQSTGLKDKNDNKIFEGDILIYVVDGEHDVNEKYLVVFDNDEAAFRTKFYCEGKYMCYEDIIPCENFEIIGNIYDNPELLESEV